MIAVEQLDRQLQRRPGTEETIGPTTHKHFAIALLLPHEVGDPVHASQAVHRLVPGGQVVEERGFHLGVSPVRHSKAEAGFLIDFPQHCAQISMAQVERQRVSEDGGQLSAEQHLLDRVGGRAALDIANEVTLKRAVVVTNIERHQPLHRRRRLNGQRGPARCAQLQTNVIADQGVHHTADGQHLVQFHAHAPPPR
ncbi:hypothetical protein D3C87_1339640 [compost metagenome]